MQHTETEQVKPGAPVHLALDKLQAVDLPLGLSIAGGTEGAGYELRDDPENRP